MSTPTAEDVGRSYQRAHAQAEFVRWLEGAAEALDRIAAHFPRTEDFSAGKVCMLRDMLKGTVGEETMSAELWQRVAESDARSLGAGVYSDAMNRGLSHDEAEKACRQATEAVRHGGVTPLVQP